jgi:hypothetical protein
MVLSSVMSNSARLAEELSDRGLDITVPNVARIYDYFLGGKDNFEADRRAADELARLIPGSGQACRANRVFLGRVVRYLAGEAGIRQFVDIGSGLPTVSNVHEIAKDVDADARVVYVDYDPVVVLHSRAILEDKPKGVAVVKADLRSPDRIIGDSRVRDVIDFAQPVAVLMLAILHFVTDEERPEEIIGRFTDVLVSGSYLALSHITDEDVAADRSRAAQQVYRGASAPAVPRSPARIAVFFDGLQMVDPGVVSISDWRMGPGSRADPDAPRLIYGGVAVKEQAL